MVLLMVRRMQSGNLCLTVKRQKKMKKFFNLILAALVIIGAAACTKSDEIVDQTQQSEGLSFYANVVNDVTRAYIDDTDGDKTWNTVWEGNETLQVGNYYFSNTKETPNKFTCADANATELLGKSVTISGKDHQNFNSLSGKSAYFIWTNIESFSVDQPINLTSQISFLHYTYNGKGAVTLKLHIEHKNGSTIESLKTFRKPDGGSFEYVEEMTFEGKGEIFVPFWIGLPEWSDTNATLSYSIDGVKCKETTIKNICWGKVYNLGELTDPVKSAYGVVGSFQGWDVAVGKPVTMYEAKDGWCVARGVELYKSDEFKIVQGNSWDVNYGLASAGILALDKEIAVVTSNSQNMKAAKNGKFDISLNATTKKIKYTCVEEYTGTVDIKINNKANWSPLYITLKKGASVIADKQLVTDNKIAVDMNYIAEELSYTLSNGTKTKSGIVNIAKDGASITLEENVILLKVQLDTANSKQYWGNTMKIHAWNTGTSFDTNWPGNTMKAEGNYTWSIEVPSELVGKTIDFLVHNGNGWQCPDAKVTIKAEGNTITGSSIGIK